MNNVYLIRPDPCDAAWAAMVGSRTPLQAARYLARWLHVRSPRGVSGWTHEQLTLSACSSGLASFDVSNDLYGLTGSILRAGASAVVGSRWPVSDSFAVRFMASLYQRLHSAKQDASLAFEQTSTELAKGERLENWAAFSFLGL